MGMLCGVRRLKGLQLEGYKECILNVRRVPLDGIQNMFVPQYSQHWDLLRKHAAIRLRQLEETSLKPNSSPKA